MAETEVYSPTGLYNKLSGNIYKTTKYTTIETRTEQSVH